MPTLIVCPSCSKRLSVPATAAGRSVRCPSCSKRFTIPDDADAEREDDADDRDEGDDDEPEPSRTRGGSRKRPVNNNRTLFIVAGGVGAALLVMLLAGVGVVFLVMGTIKPEQASHTPTSTSNPTPLTPTTPKDQPPASLKTPDPTLPAPTQKPNPIRPQPPKANPPAWIADATRELDAAGRQPKRVDPIKPTGMTPDQFDALKESAKDIFTSVLPVDDPSKFPGDGEEAIAVFELLKFDAVVVMPESSRVVRREGYTRLARLTNTQLRDLANVSKECLRLNDDPKLLAAMRARLPWKERKELFAKFAEITSVSGWSLLHPFDELSGEEMKAVVGAAGKAKANGLGALAVPERGLILKAGATGFFAERLKAGRDPNALPTPEKQPGVLKPETKKAERLNRIDAEAMAAFTKRDLRGGTTKLLDVAKEYQKLTPDDCTPDEALAVGIIMTRIAVLIGKQSKEEVTLAYVQAGQQYARKGGIGPNEYEDWYKNILAETVKAAGQK